MLPHFPRRLAAAGAVGAALLAGGTVAAAPAVMAAPTVVQINNTTVGEAGYYANDNTMTRFRDVQATTVVKNTFKQLNGASATAPGGIGDELCNDNTNFAAQLGIEWNGTQFLIEWNDGTLTDPAAETITDPCAQDGLLNNGSGITFPHPIIPVVGDTLKFEIFYQPTGHHYFQFKVTDVTQNRSEVKQVFTGPHNLYEFGIGVLTNDATLTGGAVNLLNTFTATSANYYSATKAQNSIDVPAHWDLEEAQLENGSSQVTLSPDNSLNAAGTSFSLFEGSTSAGPRH